MITIYPSLLNLIVIFRFVYLQKAFQEPKRNKSSNLKQHNLIIFVIS